MNHSFIKSILNPDECAICKYDEISHTKNASCDSCDYIGNCEINHVTKSLQCPDCINLDTKLDASEAKRNTELINHNGHQKDPEKATFISDISRANDESLIQSARSLNQILEKSKLIDASIVSDTSLYNAQTIATQELIDAINNDDAIENKLEVIQKTICERFETLQKNIWDKQNEVYKATQQALSLRDSLRSYGNNLRKEIRTRIEQADSQYIPQKKEVKVVVKREKKSAADRVIEAIMLAAGVDKDTARKMYEAGNFG